MQKTHKFEQAERPPLHQVEYKACIHYRRDTPWLQQALPEQQRVNIFPVNTNSLIVLNKTIKLTVQPM